jgi:hypothetical protein
MKSGINRVLVLKGILNSATDIANYVYCPVNYSISKSYKLPPNILAQKGTAFHQRKILLPNIPKEVSGKTPQYLNDSNKLFFEDIFSSELVYSGHSENEQNEKYFINHDVGFVGQPDYIYRNKRNEYFVVEEKFKNSFNDNNKGFNNSHKAQISAYISFLIKHPISYGYLVYWSYEFGSEYPTNCLVLRIEKSDNLVKDSILQLSLVKDFNQKKRMEINFKDINLVKFAKCVNNIICGHKTMKFDYLTLYYDTTFFKLYYAKFPEKINQDGINLSDYDKDVQEDPVF